MARPTVMTKEVLDKLRQAFLIGATNDEACGYADISVKTLYNYIEKQPEFLQQIEQWKNEPILKAKTTVVKSLGDIKNAQWYLERKKKAEFAVRSEVTGKDGEDFFSSGELTIKVVDDRDNTESKPTDSA